MRTTTKHVLALLALCLLLPCSYSVAQDAHSSVGVNILNKQLSADGRKISFDVYYQDIDPAHQVGLMAYTFRARIPVEAIGTGAKRCTLANADATMGAYSATLVLQKDAGEWVAKFQSSKLIGRWKDARILDSEYPGTKVGTYTIENVDGMPFTGFKNFQLKAIGKSATLKLTASIYLEGTQKLAPNSTINMPESQIKGLGAEGTTDNSSAENVFSVYPNSTSNGFYVTAGSKPTDIKLYSATGELKLQQTVTGKTYIDISAFAAGAYILRAGDINTKIVKN